KLCNCASTSMVKTPTRSPSTLKPTTRSPTPTTPASIPARTSTSKNATATPPPATSSRLTSTAARTTRGLSSTLASCTTTGPIPAIPARRLSTLQPPRTPSPMKKDCVLLVLPSPPSVCQSVLKTLLTSSLTLSWDSPQSNGFNARFACR